MSLDTAKGLLSDLNAKYQDGDVLGGNETLTKLKILALDFPTGSQDHMMVTAESLELGILLAVKDGDLDAFARNVAQVKPLYNVLKTTSRKTHILGLNLMSLLVENRLSEFHSELELLSEAEAGSTFVSFPINLERELMVGIYDEILNVTVPDPSYEFFVESLMETVRDSIADCVEVSYKTMKISDAMLMMKFDTQEALSEYIGEYRDDWIVEGDTLCFQPPPSGSKASDVPSMTLISQNLSYATEMERIV